MTIIDGRVALVTGGGRGIGRGIALALAAYGAKVAVTARSTEQIEAVATEIREAGGTAVALTADIASYEDVQRVVRETEAQLGPIDILVNNAGIIGPLNPIEETAPVLWAKTLQINVLGSYYCIREVLPGMKARNFGRIINLGSGAARKNGMPHAAAYSISKTSLDMLTRNVSTELAETEIAINTVYPGVVDTEMVHTVRTTDGSHPIIKNRFQEMNESGGFAQPEDVGRQFVAVMLGDWRGEVLDVREIPDELQAILDANPA